MWKEEAELTEVDERSIDGLIYNINLKSCRITEGLYL